MGATICPDDSPGCAVGTASPVCPITNMPSSVGTDDDFGHAVFAYDVAAMLDRIMPTTGALDAPSIACHLGLPYGCPGHAPTSLRRDTRQVLAHPPKGESLLWRQLKEGPPPQLKASRPLVGFR